MSSYVKHNLLFLGYQAPPIQPQECVTFTRYIDRFVLNAKQIVPFDDDVILVGYLHSVKS